MTVPAAETTHELLVTVGVDTHLDSHVAVAVVNLVRRLGEVHIPTTETGYAELLRWATKLGRLEAVGVEGAGSFGTLGVNSEFTIPASRRRPDEVVRADR